jgi:hypothetical protein
LFHPQFQSDVTKPLQIDNILDNQGYFQSGTFWGKFFNCFSLVQSLSGGELQRVALILCLGTPADIYLIDEPSAYLGAPMNFFFKAFLTFIPRFRAKIDCREGYQEVLARFLLFSPLPSNCYYFRVDISFIQRKPASLWSTILLWLRT